MTGERMTRTQFLQRASAAFCGVVCFSATAAVLILVESRSALVLATVTLNGLSGAAFLFLALSRKSRWDSLCERTRWLLSPNENRPESKRVGLQLLAVGLVGYVVLLAMLFPQNDTFVGEDEEAYLVTAREIADFGGPVVFLKSLYSGEFAESNRHPLYLWLLSGSPEFGPGKVVSVLIGLWTMGLVIGLCVQKRFGWVRTGLLCAFLGMNGAWTRFSVTIGCEVLLVGLVACVWFQFSERTSSLKTLQDSEPPRSQDGILLLASGFLLGLLWLTKGTGLLMMAGFVAWLFLRAKLRRGNESQQDISGKHRWALHAVLDVVIVLSVWLVVASPLLCRNKVRYGSPLHNVNSWLLFADEYSDPVALSERQTIGEAARAYWQTHSVAQILKREVTGLFWETFILVRSLGPPHLDDDLRVVPGSIIALLAVLGWLVSRGDEKWLLLIWLSICVPTFAWYVPVAAGERFVLPLIVPILCYAAEGTVHLTGKLAGRKL